MSKVFSTKNFLILLFPLLNLTQANANRGRRIAPHIARQLAVRGASKGLFTNATRRAFSTKEPTAAELQQALSLIGRQLADKVAPEGGLSKAQKNLLLEELNVSLSNPTNSDTTEDRNTFIRGVLELVDGRPDTTSEQTRISEESEQDPLTLLAKSEVSDYRLGPLFPVIYGSLSNSDDKEFELSSDRSTFPFIASVPAVGNLTWVVRRQDDSETKDFKREKIVADRLSEQAVEQLTQMGKTVSKVDLTGNLDTDKLQLDNAREKWAELNDDGPLTFVLNFNGDFVNQESLKKIDDKYVAWLLEQTVGEIPVRVYDGEKFVKKTINTNSSIRTIFTCPQQIARNIATLLRVLDRDGKTVKDPSTGESILLSELYLKRSRAYLVLPSESALKQCIEIISDN